MRADGSLHEMIGAILIVWYLIKHHAKSRISHFLSFKQLDQLDQQQEQQTRGRAGESAEANEDAAIRSDRSEDDRWDWGMQCWGISWDLAKRTLKRQLNKRYHRKPVSRMSGCIQIAPLSRPEQAAVKRNITLDGPSHVCSVCLQRDI